MSGFDEPTIDGIVEGFIASTDWRPIDQVIRVDLSVDVREYAVRIKTPTLLIAAKHDQIVPPAYSENMVPHAKTLELNSGHLIFWKSQLNWLPPYCRSANRKQFSSLEMTPRMSRRRR
jgi:3-oxoadipate enol-lactonase